MNKPHILVIEGSVRNGRNGKAVADWTMSQLSKHEEAIFELVDLKELALPMFDQEMPPSAMKPGQTYDIPSVAEWSKKVAKADGFVIVTPEYNHGYPAGLKNAIDYLYQEWNNKAVGFVSYGNLAGGARSTEQLRQVAGELQLADVRAAVHIPLVWEAFTENGTLKHEEATAASLKAMVEQLVRWSVALQQARS